MEQLQNTETFCGILQEQYLSVLELEELRNSSNVVTYEKPEIILRQNTRTSHIVQVKSGLVKVFKESHNKRPFILKVAREGEFLGLSSVYGSNLHQYSASAIGSCDICFVDFYVFNKIVQRNKDFALSLIKLLSEDNNFIFDRLMGQIHKQLPGRIADVILYFAEHIYRNTTFEFPLSRKELAALAGTTKESFIRTLAEFKHDKIISLEGSKVTVNSMKIIHTLSKLG